MYLPIPFYGFDGLPLAANQFIMGFHPSAGVALSAGGNSSNIVQLLVALWQQLVEGFLNMAPVMESFVTNAWSQLSDWLADVWEDVALAAEQPNVYAAILTWAIVFTVVSTLILTLGFGSVGVGMGTAASAFQSFMYGGFTPAGGLFATLTSMAMVGTLEPVALLVASGVATLTAWAVWMIKSTGDTGVAMGAVM